jgi:hypothetical protein
LLVDKDGLSRRYFDLVGLKWEEKYNAEKLSRLAREEEATLLRQRLASAKSEQATVDPQLVKQISMLQDQISVLTTERDGLRKLYVATSIDETNMNGHVSIVRDLDKKFALLHSRRNEKLKRVEELREQLTRTLTSFAEVERLRSVAKGPVPVADLVKWVYAFVYDSSGSIKDATGVCCLTSVSIYEEDAKTLSEGLSLSFEAFQASIDKNNASLNNTIALVEKISKLEVDKEGVLKEAHDILGKYLSAYNSERMRP